MSRIKGSKSTGVAPVVYVVLKPRGMVCRRANVKAYQAGQTTVQKMKVIVRLIVAEMAGSRRLDSVNRYRSARCGGPSMGQPVG